MPPSSGGVPVETLRSSVRAYAEDVGYRAAADAVGMSVGGLHAFIGGTTPYERTIRKLHAWYVAAAAEKGGELAPELAQAALGLLVRHLPERARAGAARAMLEDLRQRTEKAGAPMPDWLRQGAR